jgi:hypothetical protein
MNRACRLACPFSLSKRQIQWSHFDPKHKATHILAGFGSELYGFGSLRGGMLSLLYIPIWSEINNGNLN